MFVQDCVRRKKKYAKGSYVSFNWAYLYNIYTKNSSSNKCEYDKFELAL